MSNIKCQMDRLGRVAILNGQVIMLLSLGSRLGGRIYLLGLSEGG